MNAVWQQLTLTSLAADQWCRASWAYRVVGLLQGWRRSSWLLRWADELAVILLSILFVLAPFVSTTLVGVLLIACGGFWLLLTVSDPASLNATVDASDSGRSRLAAIRAGLTPIHLLVLLYWGIAVIATGISPVKKAALAGLGTFSLYFMMFALAAQVLRSPRLRSWLLGIYLHTALVVSVYGLQQWRGGAAALATWVDPESPLSQTTRVYSYLGNPNLLAGYLLPAVAFSAVAIFAWRGLGPKLLAGVMTVVNTACLVLTFSRGGWIGLVVLGLVLLLLLAYWWSVELPRFWRTWLLPMVLGSLTFLLVVAVLVVEPLRDRVTSIFAGRGDSSNNFRINVWTAVFQMIHDRPFLGIGPGHGTFNKIYPLYQLPRYSALSAYSIYLETAVETGLIGLAAFLWLLVVTANQGWINIQRLRTLRSAEGYWLIGAIAAFFGTLSHGFVDTVWYRPEINTLWWLILALIASYYQGVLPLPTAQPSEDA